MALSRSGEWWRGTDDGDLAAYVRSFRAGGHEVTDTRRQVCAACGAGEFCVLADDEQGVAVAGCLACAAETPLGDSADHADDAEVEACECPCGNDTFTVAIGYAVGDDEEVRWLSVGLRCVADGIVGVYADWKIDYAPTAHLILPPA